MLDLVARVERCSIREAAVKLTEWFGARERSPQCRVEAPCGFSNRTAAPFSTQRHLITPIRIWRAAASRH